MIFLTLEEILFTSMIFSLVISILSISGYLIMIIGGTIYLRNPEKIVDSILFTIIGVMEVLYSVIAQNLISVINNIPGISYEDVILTVDVIYLVIPNIISLITFGIIFIILGERNKQNFGNNLIYSGILWTISSTTTLIFILLQFTLPSLFYSSDFSLISGIIGIIVMIIMVISRIFYLVYAFNINDKYFKFSAGALLLSSILIIIQSTILYLF